MFPSACTSIQAVATYGKKPVSIFVRVRVDKWTCARKFPRVFVSTTAGTLTRTFARTLIGIVELPPPFEVLIRLIAFFTSLYMICYGTLP